MTEKPKLSLERFDERDADRLHAWVRSEEEMFYWAGHAFSWPLDLTQLVRYARSADPSTRWIWRACSNGETCGHIELNLDQPHRAAQLNRVLVAPDRRGHGIGGSMVAATLDLGFGDFDLHRIGLRVYDANEPGLALYRGLGFTVEGHLRDTTNTSRGFWSAYEMSILEDEWRATDTPLFG
jgi:RimJ/RimL family protein N-acetyltransferase